MRIDRIALGHLARFAALVILCALALQVVFVARIALMAVLDPHSTTFQRSEMLRLVFHKRQLAWSAWSQPWVGDAAIAADLKRAVIASEDAGFAEHAGVDWDAIERAWERNQKAEQRPASRAPRAAKIVGGSTITQQLAKNLLLSSERTVARKAQEFVLTMVLEALLSKRRILEIYLNNVEWGEGIFGAQAAARHYFRVDAARLSAEQCARLAVMLPAPKRFERRPHSAYVLGRAATIVARMGTVELP